MSVTDGAAETLRPATKSETFFIVVPPYFERVALYELQRNLLVLKHPLQDYEIHQGGIELALPVDIGVTLNSLLKIPTRILMRLATQEVLSFESLETFFKTISWKDFGPLRDVYVSSRSSKMKMKEAIKRSFVKAVPHKSNPRGTDVYIRVFRDQCTLSVDTSGDDLFQRGLDKWVGEAPLRDNMASGLLQLALQGADAGDGWQIIDPMAGAGTFLTEAIQLSRPLKRSFCFENWTGSRKVVAHDVLLQPARLDLRGYDKNPKMREVAQKNISMYDVSKSGSTADVQTADLLHAPIKLESTLRRLVILNPPYGKRIAIKEKNFFQRVIQSIEEVYAPDRLALIVPRKIQVLPQSMEKTRHLEFSNNGIDVEFFVFVKKKAANSGL